MHITCTRFPQMGRLIWSVLVLAGVLVWPAGVSADSAVPVLYRLFLRTGHTLVSYGDYARVGSDVVFSIPVGGDPTDGRTQLVSVPADGVDWPATDRYAESARAAHYAATRGEADFATLSVEIAEQLHAIAESTDAVLQLSIAAHIRRALVEWSTMHHAYRFADLRQIVLLLDETIAVLRSGSRVGLDGAPVPLRSPPVRTPLMPFPEPAEMITVAMRAAEMTRVSAERVSLLQAVVGLLETEGAGLPDVWRDRMRVMALEDIDTELDVDRSYVDLTGRLLTRARVAAGRADAAAVGELLRVARARDTALGARRPNVVASLLASLEQARTDAETLREARTRWERRVTRYRQTEPSLGQTLRRFEATRKAFEAIRSAVVSEAADLRALEDRCRTLGDALVTTPPPNGFEGVHSVLHRVSQLCVRATTLRRRDPGALTHESRDAASAAAGALMLVDHAGDQLAGLLAYPELP